jgi:hypothetical protein
VLALIAALEVPATTAGDPFTFFQPSLRLSAIDRRQLDQGRAIARIVPSNPSDVAVFAAVPIDIDGDRLVAWTRRIEELKKSSYVLTIGRFSDPPRIEDLAPLSLDDDDLSAVRACQPGHCALKLTAVEMTELQRVTAAAGQDWKSMAQRTFRAIVLQRVNAYLSGGRVALPPYADHRGSEVSPATAFASLLSQSVYLSQRLPEFVEHLTRNPQKPMPAVESLVYWSKEHIVRKPIISATHVSILRNIDDGMVDAAVIGDEIFSTHYVNASFSVTAIIRGEPGSPNYLAYLNRTQVDVLDGMFGGLVRSAAQRRLKHDAVDVLRERRMRLESGLP